MAIVAKPQLRKPAAVAERRPVGATKSASAAKPTGGKALPQKPGGFRPHLPSSVPAPIETRTAGLTTWARDVRSELRKCAWPTRQETMRLTTVIIAISIVVGFILGGFDALFAAMMTGLLQ